jgi:hypothetical protein
VHRFPVDDAIVLFGEIKNKNASEALHFEPKSLGIAIRDREFPVAFADCPDTVAAGQTVKFAVIEQGDLDGGRAHIDARNEFRVLLPHYTLGNGSVETSKTIPATHPVCQHHKRHHVESEGKSVVKAASAASPTPAPVPWWRRK